MLCCITRAQAGEERSLHVRHMQDSAVFTLQWSGQGLLDVPCISPSGGRILFTTTAQRSADQGLWVLERQACGQYLPRCLHALWLYAIALAWHPTELLCGVLTSDCLMAFSLKGSTCWSLRFEQRFPAFRDYPSYRTSLSFLPCGTQLQARLTANKAVLVTLADSSAVCVSPAQQYTAALAAARPMHWYCDLGCACLWSLLGPCLGPLKDLAILCYCM